MTPHEHIRAVRQALEQLDAELDRIGRWGHHLAEVLAGGGRLLAVGNGGSAAQAQHLTAELVGRYESERPPLSALALHAETSTLTALGNDYPPDQLFARQVRAHGRDGDVLLALSTSGRSANVIAAVDAARALGLTTWALTGPAPNPLAGCADDSLCVAAPSTATVQEVHQVVIHLLCRDVDEALDADARLVARSAAQR
jgi:D-sedoheptulose 7-phosphate isomerase